MAKAWADIDEKGRELVRAILTVTRGQARGKAALLLISEHARTCTKHTSEEHVLMAIDVAEHAEEALDAALEHLGFPS